MPTAHKKREFSTRHADENRLSLAAIGMESEFAVFLDDRPVKPEHIFRDPRAFIRGPLMHRQGTSYHLPTGGAVYFDTGVIEVATPVIEIERGCSARAGRSLWEAILYLRQELDDWEKRTHRTIRLQGFSTHYNISFDLPEASGARDIRKLAKLLSYILPIPVMLLAANKRSTGVGVRPRPGRIEITCDFTPEPSLMIAAATFITGVVRHVMTWESYSLGMLEKHKIPVIERFKPIPHTSRKGWLAKDHTFDPRHQRSPFTEDVNAKIWNIRNIEGRDLMSTREIASYLFDMFYRPIARLADAFTFRLISGVISGHAPSLLELPDRPAAYDHVGTLCSWDNLFPERTLRRSRYERILMHAIAGDELSLDGRLLKPVAMKGWSKVVFRNRAADGDTRAEQNGERLVLSIDQLLMHLENWTHQVNGRKRAA